MLSIAQLLLAGWIALVALTAYKLRRTIRFFAEIPRRSRALASLPGPTGLGVLGQWTMLTNKDSHREATRLANEYGPVVRFRVMHYQGVIVTDPILARAVLRSPHLDKFRFQYSFLDEFLGGVNLLTGPTNAHWKALRKGVAPAFSVTNMKFAFDVIRGACDNLSDILLDRARAALADGKASPDAVNVDNILLRESMDVIGRVGFEQDMGALAAFAAGDEAGAAEGPGRNVAVMLAATEEIVDRLDRPHKQLAFWDAGVQRGHALMAHWRGVVRALLAHIKATHTAPGSFCTLLQKVRDPKTGAPLTDAQMAPEIAALFFAGIDTTGHTGTWALYLLSQHPDVEAKIVAELDAAELLVTPARRAPRRVEWSDLAKLPYLQAFIKEVLRMYPPVGIGQIRVCHTQDLVLAGGRLTVPRGALVWVPHHAMQNAAHNWDAPDAFRPERWLETPGCEYADRLPMPKDWYTGWADEQAAALAKGCADAAAADAVVDANEASSSSLDRPKRYFPFADGPRNCVGQSLAMTTLPTTLAHLLSRFHFRLADSMGGAAGVAKREQYTLVVGIKDGMFMHAEPRPGLL